ncbi:MAG: hypothetical protein K6L73_12750 [Cellvibrionaceae bacterium]
MKFKKIATLILAVGILGGCVATPIAPPGFSPKAKVHKSIEGGITDSKRVLLLEPSVVIRELGVGTQEVVPEWTEEAKTMISSELSKNLTGLGKIDLLTEVSLSDAEKKIVDEHVALFDVLANTTMLYHPLPNWKAKFSDPDDTLGEGLKFLKEKAGIDLVVFASGEDYQASAGRKGAMVAGAILGAFTGIAVMPTAGIANLNLGVVDTNTGNLLWEKSYIGKSKDLNDEKDVSKLVACMFDTIPTAAKLEDKKDKKRRNSDKHKRSSSGRC